MANSTTQNDAVVNGKTDLAATGTPTLLKTNASSLTTSFTTGVAKQLNTDRAVHLYVTVTTASALAIAMGPDSSTSITIMPSQSAALGVIHLFVPAGWYVKLTGTMANVTCTQLVNA